MIKSKRTIEAILSEMNCEASWTDKAEMPIPLYKEIKVALREAGFKIANMTQDASEDRALIRQQSELIEEIAELLPDLRKKLDYADDSLSDGVTKCYVEDAYNIVIDLMKRAGINDDQ